MKRRYVATAALALALILAQCCVARAGAGVVACSDVRCQLDAGLRLAVSIEDGSLRGSVVVPSFSLGFDAQDGPARWLGGSSFEILSVSIAGTEAVRWGVPLLRLIAGATAGRARLSGTGGGVFQ